MIFETSNLSQSSRQFSYTSQTQVDSKLLLGRRTTNTIIISIIRIVSFPSLDCPFWHIMYCRQLHSFKMRLLGRDFRTLIRIASFLSPIASRYCLFQSVRYRRQPHSYKTHLLGRRLHTFIRNAPFPSQSNAGPHNKQLSWLSGLRCQTQVLLLVKGREFKSHF